MKIQETLETVSRCVLATAVIAWGVPLAAIACAQFVRGTYLRGEYFSPRDDIEIYAVVAGWFIAACAFVATLLLWRKGDRRYAVWSLGLSATYFLTPIAIILNSCIELALRHFHIS